MKTYQGEWHPEKAMVGGWQGSVTVQIESRTPEAHPPPRDLYHWRKHSVDGSEFHWGMESEKFADLALSVLLDYLGISESWDPDEYDPSKDWDAAPAMDGYLTLHRTFFAKCNGEEGWIITGAEVQKFLDGIGIEAAVPEATRDRILALEEVAEMASQAMPIIPSTHPEYSRLQLALDRLIRAEAALGNAHDFTPPHPKQIEALNDDRPMEVGPSPHPGERCDWVWPGGAYGDARICGRNPSGHTVMLESDYKAIVASMRANEEDWMTATGAKDSDPHEEFPEALRRDPDAVPIPNWQLPKDARVISGNEHDALMEVLTCAEGLSENFEKNLTPYIQALDEATAQYRDIGVVPFQRGPDHAG